MLPVVCSSGKDVASSIAALSRYPSWHSQRRIHVLAGNVSPILEEVVYLGALGLKGGGGGEASRSGEPGGDLPTGPYSHQVRFESFHTAAGSESETPTSAQRFEPFESFRTADQPLAKQEGSDIQSLVDQHKLAELGAVLLDLAKSKHEAGASAKD